MPTNASVFLTLIKTFTIGPPMDGNPSPWFGHYPAEFFDGTSKLLHQGSGPGSSFSRCLIKDTESLAYYEGIHVIVDGYQRVLSKHVPFCISYLLGVDELTMAVDLDARRDPWWTRQHLG